MILLIGQQIEDRRLFTYEERKQILKQTYGICACCGKKLTTKTMQVEHVIPISRGGTNDLSNLIALCPKHNKLKSNMLYLPDGFYMAIADRPLCKRLNKQFTEWFLQIKDDFDIEAFPMIAPAYNMIMSPVPFTHRSKLPFSENILLQWSYIGTERYEEIEAVTNLDLKEVRTKTNELYLTEHHKVALYSLRKVSTDKILAVCAVLLDCEKHYMTIYMPWCCMTTHLQHVPIESIAYNLLDTITNIADIPIHRYVLATEYENSLLHIRQAELHHFFGYGYQNINLGTADAIEITTENKSFIDMNL